MDRNGTEVLGFSANDYRKESHCRNPPVISDRRSWRRRQTGRMCPICPVPALYHLRKGALKSCTRARQEPPPRSRAPLVGPTMARPNSPFVRNRTFVGELASVTRREASMISPAEEFRRHAGECSQMARTTPDKDSKNTWTSLAERWSRCAERAEIESRQIPRTSKYRHPESPIYRKAS
jgi:hypothetical protein